MSPRSLAVARTSTRLLLADPAPTIVMMGIPLILAPFLIPGARAQARLAGDLGATGAETVVPGMALLFALLSSQTVISLFFREHAWGTWDRLRASSASTADVVVGKALPAFVAQLLATGLVLGVGALAYGYRVTGSALALLVVLVAFIAALICYGVALVAVFATMDAAMVVGNLGGMLLAGLGGALSPVTALPGWAQAIAHLSPAYWAMRGIDQVTTAGGGVGDVLHPVAAILGFAAVMVVVAALRFRPSTVRVGTT